ncbi:hippurate hydrolase [Paramicrobacterium humi]|uniref:Hippurate hydrolase n=1 Tax=Paramicrobacterium humi TaxID=640635 RepID=A0A1H4PAL1_9MICO|nr:amidohydrolase [Microbacterium humi]SEC04440.1 hippurate hydrolase [Microbacterium humi]
MNARIDAVLTGLDKEMVTVTEAYKDFHRHPEVSLEEHRTADLIAKHLKKTGYTVKRLGGTGVVGVLANGDGSTILSRADIDALPVTEETGLDYASEVDGVMHACGHDVHIATLLGAATLLANGRDEWSGTHIALFQPAEEVAAGSQAMIDDGLTDAVPKPDAVFAQHVMSLPAGTIWTTPGPVLSAGDSIKVTVFGKGSHGSMPQLSVDPVVLAASIVLKLQTIVSRETAPGEFAVLTVGASTAGTKSNIIPDRAELLLNIRTYDELLRKHIISAIQRIVRGECSAAGSPKEPDFEFYDQYPLTDNDPNVTSHVTDAFETHFPAGVVGKADRQTASEDFSRIPDAFGTPYSYWLLGGIDADAYRAAEEKGTLTQDIPGNHSPLFAPVIEPTLSLGVQAHVVAALSYLAKQD